jgi:hypothetical protein
MFRLTPTKMVVFALFAYLFGWRFATAYTAAFCLIYGAIGNNTR